MVRCGPGSVASGRPSCTQRAGQVSEITAADHVCLYNLDAPKPGRPPSLRQGEIRPLRGREDEQQTAVAVSTSAGKPSTSHHARPTTPAPDGVPTRRRERDRRSRALGRRELDGEELARGEHHHAALHGRERISRPDFQTARFPGVSRRCGSFPPRRYEGRGEASRGLRGQPASRFSANARGIRPGLRGRPGGGSR
jgi:hypothetical protein